MWQALLYRIAYFSGWERPPTSPAVGDLDDYVFFGGVTAHNKRLLYFLQFIEPHGNNMIHNFIIKPYNVRSTLSPIQKKHSDISIKPTRAHSPFRAISPSARQQA